VVISGISVALVALFLNICQTIAYTLYSTFKTKRRKNEAARFLTRFFYFSSKMMVFVPFTPVAFGIISWICSHSFQMRPLKGLALLAHLYVWGGVVDDTAP